MANSPLRPVTSVLAKYPIPIELIAALYRANEAEFGKLMETMPEYGRARVAAYCSDRERLHHIGIRIAGTCAEATLLQAAGAKVGADLFASSRTGSDVAH
jgi:hypothetical protein